MTVSSDIGRFAIVPEWVLDAGLQGTAIKLFAVLACKYSDREGISFPSRKTLARNLGVNESTVDRAIRQLESVGALTVERNRKTEDGDFGPNLYKLILVQLGGRRIATTGGRTNAARGGCTNAHLTIPIINHTYQEPDNPVSSSLREEETGAEPSTKQQTTHKPPDPRVKQIMTWVEGQRGYPNPRRAAEEKSVRRMLNNGYSPEQIQLVYLNMKAEPFYFDKEVWMMTVEGQIGAKLNGHAPPRADSSSRSPADRRIKQEQSIRQAHPQRLPEYR